MNRFGLYIKFGVKKSPLSIDNGQIDVAVAIKLIQHPILLQIEGKHL